jgi:hypothetical protein
MADSGAERARRARRHKAGDHSLCSPGRCPELSQPEPANTVRAGAGLPDVPPPDVAAAVREDIEALPPKLRRDSRAAAALFLAGLMRDATPRDAATIWDRVRSTLAELRAAAAAAPGEADPVDELEQRRQRRRGAAVPEGADVGDQRV